MHPKKEDDSLPVSPATTPLSSEVPAERSGEEQKRSVPVLYYLMLSVCAVMAMGFSNSSLRFVSYPTKVVLKSSKVVIIMVLVFFVCCIETNAHK
jgi:hypothetical protein